MISRTVETARRHGLPSVVLTFDPHPAEVLRAGSHPPQLTSLARKAELVEQLGADVFLVLPFTLELSQLTPDEFVHHILVDALQPETVIVGEDFTFGHKASGDVNTMRMLGERFGFSTYGASLQGHTLSGEHDNGEVIFSSTYVRSCLAAGDVSAAAEVLGRPYRLEGIVGRGAGRGHGLGYPTANLAVARFAAIPADGVYSCWFVRPGRHEERLAAAVSIGTNPTFSGGARTVEAFVLDITENLYGQDVALDFVARLRGQVRFDTPEELAEQMDEDVRSTRTALGLT